MTLSGPAASTPTSSPNLEGAVVRSWSSGPETFTWSLLARCPDRGWAPITLTYTGAFFLGVDGSVLDGVPLQPGRSYVVHGHHVEPTEIGGIHRMAFWPTPQFRIGFASLSFESGCPQP